MAYGYAITADDVAYGISQLVDAYSATRLTPAEASSSLVSLGRRFGPSMEWPSTIKTLVEFATIGASGFFTSLLEPPHTNNGNKAKHFKLREIVASVEVLSRFAEIDHHSKASNTNGAAQSASATQQEQQMKL